MNIRMLCRIDGGFHVNAGDGSGWPNGVAIGQVVDVPVEHALRYCTLKAGVAEPVEPSELAQFSDH